MSEEIRDDILSHEEPSVNERPESPNAHGIVEAMNDRETINQTRVLGIKREEPEATTFAKLDDPLLCRFDTLETHLGRVVEELRILSTQLVKPRELEPDNVSDINQTTPSADADVAEHQEGILKKTYNTVNSVTKGTSKRAHATSKDSETEAEESDRERDMTNDDDIRNLMPKRRKKNGGKTSEQYRRSVMEAMKVVEHKLPMLENEGTEQYWSFMSQYKERTKGLLARTKLNLLYNHCDPRLRIKISHCLKMSSKKGLKTATNALKMKFGDVTQYIEKQTEKLLNWPHVKRNDLEELTELYDFVESITYFTGSFDRLPEIDIRFYITQLTKSLDDTRIDRWNNIKPKASKKGRDILQLREFLRKEVENLGRSVKRVGGASSSVTYKVNSKEIPKESQGPSESTDKVTRRDRRTEFGFTTQTRPSTSRPITCDLCYGEHSLAFCDLFKSASIHQRKKILIGHRKCFNCLKSGHSARQCRARPCDINGCGGYHSRLLHDTEFRKSGSIAHVNNDENKRKPMEVPTTKEERQ
ncbi:uncharacterized protein LOC122248544 [Penaeus japonicus]|uniref:uncharacterized protein LOC122248544 n=1 Tax=Penaeus japonicus TaxID=27405 RepID=UPI001C70E013|nr:uncharacterized protein LOC122248544 [Penaeus japonicus]